MNAYPHHPADLIHLEVLLDIRRMVITQNSGDGYSIQALKEEIHEWWEKQQNDG